MQVASIEAVEYFVDEDPGHGQGTGFTVSAGDTVDITEQISTAGLATGLHTLHVRARNEEGRWGITEARAFYVYPPPDVTVPSPLVRLEYFFNTDPGFGAGVEIPIAQADSINMTSSLATTGLELDSTHTVTLRVQNAAGMWSLGESESFVIKTGTNDPPVVANPIPNQGLDLDAGDPPFVHDLNAPDSVFTDPNGDVLAYQASSSDSSVATPSISGSILTVTGVSGGSATITVEANDGNGGTEQTTFTVTVTGTSPGATVTYPLVAGWNLISLAVSVPDSTVNAVFPGAIVAYEFDPVSAYQQASDLEIGKGYWLNMTDAGSIDVTGQPVSLWTKALPAGWNLIGSVATEGTVQTDPAGALDVLYAFDPGRGYDQVGTIPAGLGVWAYLNQAATVGVVGGGSVTKPVALRSRPSDQLSDMARLLFRDAEGGTRTLYIGTASTAEEAGFRLPPVPPQGIFDVRFADGKYVAVSRTAAYPIEIRGSRSGGRMEWERLPAVEGRPWELLDQDDSVVMSEMGSFGAFDLPERIQRLTIRLRPLPDRLVLEQNYPNPFNPETTIQYALPKECRIRLAVYNLVGQEIRVLVDKRHPAGYHRVIWDARDASGEHIAAGIYFYRLVAGASTEARKMMILK